MNLEFLNNEYFLIATGLLVAVYGAMSRVELPPFMVSLFKNDIFRVVFLSLLLIYRFEKAPHVALIVALTFILTMNYITEDEVRVQTESFKNIRK
jgi:hypothetical protein